MKHFREVRDDYRAAKRAWIGSFVSVALGTFYIIGGPQPWGLIVSLCALLVHWYCGNRFKAAQDERRALHWNWKSLRHRRFLTKQLRP